MGTTRLTTPQSITVEYIVTGSLDGVTAAPVVQIDQSREDATPFDKVAQIYRPLAVERLGLIDPDLLVGGSIGTRCIPFLSLDTVATGAVLASVDIVGVRGSPSDVFFQKQIEDLAGDAGPIYLDGGFNVPQGSDIRLRGYTAAPGEQIRVRVTILVPATCSDVAAFHCACPNGGDTPQIDAGCLGKFLVAKDPDCAPYQSIGAAYQAAKDAGHGYGNLKGPAQVLVCPGDYDENVILDTAGIDVIAVAKNPTGQNVSITGVAFDLPVPGETRLLGTITVSFLPTGGPVPRGSWQGIDIVPQSGSGVVFTGANPQQFKLNDCIVQSSDGFAIHMNNTFTASVLDIRNVALGTLSVDDPAILSAAPPAGTQFLRTWNVNISVPALNQIACLFDTADVFFDNSVVHGQVDCISTFVQTNETLIQATAEISSAVDLDVDSSLASIDTKLVGRGGASFVTGDGIFSHDGLSLPGDVGWAPALTVFTTGGIPQEQHWTVADLEAGGTFEITGELNILASGPSAPGAVLELPPSSHRPGPIRVIEDAATSLGPVVVTVSTTFPGDLIVVGTDAPAGTVTLPSPSSGASGGYMFVSDGSGLWYAICFCQGSCLTHALVAPDSSLAPFQSIQSAYDFLVALGADPDSPAKVLVCPGEYIEDVTMSQPGIDIVAVAKDDYSELRNFVGQGITKLRGALTINLSGFSPGDEVATGTWDGIDILANFPNGDALVFTGIRYQQAFVRHCLISSSLADPGILLDNSGSGVDGDSRLDIIRCGIENPSVASAAAFQVEDGILLLNDSVARGASPNTVLDGAVLEVVGSTIQNTTSIAGTVTSSYSKWSGLSFTAATAFFTALQSEFTAGPPLAPLGGVFVYDQFNTPGTIGNASLPFDAALDAVQKNSIPPGDNVVYIDLDGAFPPYPLTGSETNVVINSEADGSVVILPPLAVGPFGNVRRGPIRIKNRVTSPGSLTVTPAVGNTLNEGVGLPFLAAGASATFISWVSPPAAVPDWESYD